MRYKLYVKASVCMLFCLSISVISAQTSFEAETGFVFTGYSDVRIPGDSGTLFSLSNDLNAETPKFIRLKVIQPLGNRHTLSILYAPLSIKSDGTIGRDISFAGKVFDGSAELNALYRFDSYRLTYRYDFIKKLRTEFGAGVTAKIRDAEIALKDGVQTARKKNTGFVPIINFRLHYRIDNKFGVLFEGDALAAPQGRAEDIQIAATYRASSHWRFKLGYRMLEGGADNDEVYNFAMLHYAMLGIEIRQ